MGSKWESGAVPVRKRGGLGAPCDWTRGDAGCHYVRLLCITRRVGSTPRPLGSVAAVATAASPPGSVAAAARRPLALGVDTVAATAPRPPGSVAVVAIAALRFRSRHRGGARIRRSRILALLRIWLLWTRYRDGPNASCPTPWLSGPNASCPIPWLQP